MNYAKMALKVLKLITKYGRPGAILYEVNPKYTASDPNKPWKLDTPPDVDYDPIIGTFPEAALQSLAPGTTMVAYVAAVSPMTRKPVPGDLVESDGQRYIVLQVQTLKPATVALMHTLSLKGS